MRVLIDKYIPLLTDVLADNGIEVHAIEPEEFTPDSVRETDALIIRTRTLCNEALLSGSRVRFIATATIGYDHIDTDYCDRHHIHWTACPGCNAQAVCDYIEETLLETILPHHPHPKIGIVGVGHVGSLVQTMSRHRADTPPVLIDPFRHLSGDMSDCDVITFHTPLTHDGPYPTYHLCDQAFLARLKPNALIINAARGGVVDEQALLHSGHPCVIDCWEGEPNINRDLLLSPNTLLASFHIAGYSLQGKINASQMCLEAFCRYFGLPVWSIQKKAVSLSSQRGDTAPGWLKRTTEQLRSEPERFEQLRKQYPLR